MHAQLLTVARRPLVAAELPAPHPGPKQLLIGVRACAVCRTDLHVVDGELGDPKLPLIPGHEIIGTVVEKGAAAERFGPAAFVSIAAAARRICATAPVSPAIRSMAATPN